MLEIRPQQVHGSTAAWSVVEEEVEEEEVEEEEDVEKEEEEEEEEICFASPDVGLRAKSGCHGDGPDNMHKHWGPEERDGGKKGPSEASDLCLPSVAVKWITQPDTRKGN
ncbi:unnamed protein product [Boreogadus saida]